MKRSGENHPHYSLVAIDVDGTLLDSFDEVPTANIQAIVAVQEAGVHVSLATGRSSFSLMPLFKQLNLKTPYIGSGGGLIADPTNGTMIDYRSLTKECLEAILPTARQKKTIIFFTLHNGIYYETMPDANQVWKHSSSYTPIEVDDLLQDTFADPTKIAILGSPEDLSWIEEKIRKDGVPVHLSYPFPDVLDINRMDADKGSALIRLAEHLEILPERTIAIGNADNDIAMFNVAGLSVAMGNASAEIKGAADVVAPSNDENGVAWALHKFILDETYSR